MEFLGKKPTFYHRIQAEVYQIQSRYECLGKIENPPEYGVKQEKGEAVSRKKNKKENIVVMRHCWSASI